MSGALTCLLKACHKLHQYDSIRVKCKHYHIWARTNSQTRDFLLYGKTKWLHWLYYIYIFKKIFLIHAITLSAVEVFPPIFHMLVTVISSDRFLHQVIIIILEERAVFPIFITSQLMLGYYSFTLWGRMWRPFLSVPHRLWPSRLWMVEGINSSFCRHCLKHERSTLLNLHALIAERTRWTHPQERFSFFFF